MRARLYLGFLLSFLLLSILGQSPTLSASPVTLPLWSLDIHADWRPACANIEPTYTRIKREYSNRIKFIRFDVTSRKSTQAAQTLAKQLGLTAWFNQYKSQTATVALMDAHTHKVQALFQNEASMKAYQTAYNKALKTVTTRPSK